jgi:hypothetical protein
VDRKISKSDAWEEQRRGIAPLYKIYEDDQMAPGQHNECKLTGERHTTLVPAARRDSYEDMTILPVMDCNRGQY